MPRVAPKPIVQPQMFRHFVVVTLAITALLAMFSTGENRQAFEEQLAKKSEQKRLKAAELELAKEGKGGNTSLVFKDNRRSKATWGSDQGTPTAQDIGAPGDGGPELRAARRPQFTDASSSPANAEPLPEAPPPGMTMEEVIALRQKNEAAKRRNKKDEPPTQMRIDRMIEASRVRTNTPGD